MFVYVIVNSETLKLYIGQHKGSNLRKYLQTKLSDAKHRTELNSRLYRSMRKHSKMVWSIHPLVVGVESKRELDELEKHFIRVLKTQHPNVGYNICRGGEGHTGPISEATRQKMLGRTPWNKGAKMPSAYRQQVSTGLKGNTNAKGCTHTPESIQRAHSGNNYTPEWKQKISESCKKLKGPWPWTGKTLSHEHRARMSQSHKGIPWSAARRAAQVQTERKS